MKRVALSVATLLSSAYFFGGCEWGTSSSTVSEESYAARVYKDYESAASGRVSFELATLKSGPMTEFANRTFNELLPLPEHWIQMQPIGTSITDVTMEERNSLTDEWAAPLPVDEFEKLGRPLALGRYRLLEVRTTVDSRQARHQALELCWQDGASCIVVDPVVMRVDEFSQNRRRLLAEGWAVEQVGDEDVSQITSALDGGSTGDGGTSDAGTRRCVASTNLQSADAHDFPATTYYIKNLYGMDVVTLNFAAQRVRVSCSVDSAGACRASPSGYSNMSTCSTLFGYSCACENPDYNYGKSGETIKIWAQDACSWRSLGSASLSYSWSGSGTTSLNLSWQTQDSGLQKHGGSLLVSCIWQ